MTRIDILTLFPDTVGDMMNESILGRAQERDFIRIEAHQIRDYTTNRQNQVDDYPYGGGRGAVLQADPLYNCWCAVCDEAGGPVHTVFLSPCGETFTQAKARELLQYDNLVLVCGASMTLAPFRLPQSAVLLGRNAALVLELPVMVLVMLLLTVPALKKGRLYRGQGILLLLVYGLFCAVQFTL